MEIKLVEQSCPRHGCGISFWTTSEFDQRRVRDNCNYYCPNGHSIVYLGETDAQKLARITLEKNSEIADLQRQLANKSRRKRRNA